MHLKTLKIIDSEKLLNVIYVSVLYVSINFIKNMTFTWYNNNNTLISYLDIESKSSLPF